MIGNKYNEKIAYLVCHGISPKMIEHMSEPEVEDLYLNVWEIWNVL